MVRGLGVTSPDRHAAERGSEESGQFGYIRVRSQIATDKKLPFEETERIRY
jgi:hypothetical protein